MKITRSTWFPYLANPKNPEDMIKFDRKEGIIFDCVNVLNFWLIKFALVETEEIPKDKYVGLVKKNPKNSLYNHLSVAALSMILKYSIMKIGIPQEEVYKLTIVALMQSILIFNSHKSIK